MCSHFERCKRYISLSVWFFGSKHDRNIPQLCIFLCWLHVLRITCPCGWLGRAVFFFFNFSVLSYLILPLLYLPLMSFLWLQYESLYLAYLVWGLSFIYVLLSLSLPSVTSTVLACSFLIAWRIMFLYLELTSPHTTVSEVKGWKKSC